jgi:hypothetical protein
VSQALTITVNRTKSNTYKYGGERGIRCGGEVKVVYYQ